MRGSSRSHYLYIDDTNESWWFNAVDYLAEASNLQVVSPDDRHKLQPLSRQYKPRHIELVALAERPGMQKYRTDVVVNERDPIKFLNKIIVVNGMKMRCIKYVGEQRVAY